MIDQQWLQHEAAHGGYDRYTTGCSCLDGVDIVVAV